ncbi:hypothetical protein SADUNF_Sadunf16G0133900 [Salix dunnii]|uniref:Uncharacterized protein n=1 Tax=Salix dunnii TaxID=1413687 RepID=A0A835MQ70_9ROSI|nr:hypothetical protein SADUNF_Sadunf16G0133900 [Salix dunnii]
MACLCPNYRHELTMSKMCDMHERYAIHVFFWDLASIDTLMIHTLTLPIFFKDFYEIINLSVYSWSGRSDQDRQSIFADAASSRFTNFKAGARERGGARSPPPVRRVLSDGNLDDAASANMRLFFFADAYKHVHFDPRLECKLPPTFRQECAGSPSSAAGLGLLGGLPDSR